MNGAKIVSPERIAEIKAFQNADFSDCPIMTDEELKKLRPRHPEYFKPKKQAVQIRLDADVLAWFKGYGKGYQCHTSGGDVAQCPIIASSAPLVVPAPLDKTLSAVPLLQS